MALVGGEARVRCTAWPGSPDVADRGRPLNEQLEPHVEPLTGGWADYGLRAGDDLGLYTESGIVHPAVWPALANGVMTRHLVDGAWIHTRSRIRHYGIALGPDIGWRREGDASMAERHAQTMQIIYSIIEQQPARYFLATAREQGTGLLARVPHASEVLTDEFTDKMKVEFDQSDHRAHRRQEWLDNAFRKREKVLFVAQETGRTLAQAAIQFCLSEPNIAAVLPNIVRRDQLDEFVEAAHVPPISEEELAELNRIYDEEFMALEDIQPERVS